LANLSCFKPLLTDLKTPSQLKAESENSFALPLSICEAISFSLIAGQDSSLSPHFLFLTFHFDHQPCFSFDHSNASDNPGNGTCD
jgi:hypothetical protein